MRSICLLIVLLLGLFAVAQKEDKTYALSVTKSSVKINGKLINYTATTGYMPVKDENDTIKAKLFFVAYTRDGETDLSKRPILFAYNGGPGSASLWLHMGALGPKRVVMNDDGSTIPPPYQAGWEK